MSRIREVLNSKNKIERASKKRKQEELSALKQQSKFKAGLTSELRKIDALLDSDEVEYLVFQVDDKWLPKFSAAIYSGELSGYVIEQMDNSPNRFKISYKII